MTLKNKRNTRFLYIPLLVGTACRRKNGRITTSGGFSEIGIDRNLQKLYSLRVNCNEVRSNCCSKNNSESFGKVVWERGWALTDVRARRIPEYPVTRLTG